MDEELPDPTILRSGEDKDAQSHLASGHADASLHVDARLFERYDGNKDTAVVAINVCSLGRRLMYHPNRDVHVLDWFLRTVELVGKPVPGSLVSGPHLLEFQLEDGTSSTLSNGDVVRTVRVRLDPTLADNGDFLDREQLGAARPDPTRSAYWLVRGVLRALPCRHVMVASAHMLRPVDDFNQLTCHALDVVHHHLVRRHLMAAALRSLESGGEPEAVDDAEVEEQARLASLRGESDPEPGRRPRPRSVKENEAKTRERKGKRGRPVVQPADKYRSQGDARRNGTFKAVGQDLEAIEHARNNKTYTAQDFPRVIHYPEPNARTHPPADRFLAKRPSGF